MNFVSNRAFWIALSGLLLLSGHRIFLGVVLDLQWPLEELSEAIEVAVVGKRVDLLLPHVD